MPLAPWMQAFSSRRGNLITVAVYALYALVVLLELLLDASAGVAWNFYGFVALSSAAAATAHQDRKKHGPWFGQGQPPSDQDESDVHQSARDS